MQDRIRKKKYIPSLSQEAFFPNVSLTRTPKRPPERLPSSLERVNLPNCVESDILFGFFPYTEIMSSKARCHDSTGIGLYDLYSLLASLYLANKKKVSMHVQSVDQIMPSRGEKKSRATIPSNDLPVHRLQPLCAFLHTPGDILKLFLCDVLDRVPCRSKVCLPTSSSQPLLGLFLVHLKIHVIRSIFIENKVRIRSAHPQLQMRTKIRAFPTRAWPTDA